MARKRSYGTGSLYQKHDDWYGRWRTPSGRANRRVGPVRKPGTREGLTRTEAERKLQAMIDEEEARVTADPGRTIEHVAQLHSAKLTGVDRKRSHVQTFDSHVRVHLVPFFKVTPVNRITDADVERLMAHLRKKGLKPKRSRTSSGACTRFSTTRCVRAGSSRTPAAWSRSRYRVQARLSHKPLVDRVGGRPGRS